MPSSANRRSRVWRPPAPSSLTTEGGRSQLGRRDRTAPAGPRVIGRADHHQTVGGHLGGGQARGRLRCLDKSELDSSSTDQVDYPVRVFDLELDGLIGMGGPHPRQPLGKQMLGHGQAGGQPHRRCLLSMECRHRRSQGVGCFHHRLGRPRHDQPLRGGPASGRGPQDQAESESPFQPSQPGRHRRLRDSMVHGRPGQAAELDDRQKQLEGGQVGHHRVERGWGHKPRLDRSKADPSTGATLPVA